MRAQAASILSGILARDIEQSRQGAPMGVQNILLDTMIEREVELRTKYRRVRTANSQSG